MKAALLDSKNNVIGEVFDAPEKEMIVTVAGCFTEDKTPVNCKNYKISRSKLNLEKARYTQPLCKVESKNGSVYTFF